MIVSEVALYRYRLPLVRPLILKGRPHHFREGLLVRVGFVDGKVGWGEIAPLPGFSRETLAQAEAQASQTLKALKGHIFPTEVQVLSEEDFIAGKPFPTKLEVSLQRFCPELLFPSVSCGLSMVRIVYWVRRGRMVQPLNALLAGSEGEIFAQASEAVARGYRAVKLKVGMRSLDSDIALVYGVHARLQGRATLRLDANRAWTFDQALQFGAAVDDLPIEYVEEPLQNPAELHRLGQEWRLEIAVDESLAEASPHRVEDFQGLTAVIIKPMLLGNLHGDLVADYCYNEFSWVKAVISSSFESPVGLWLLARFASTIARGEPAGLDTAGWFGESTLTRPLPIANGEFDLSQSLTDSDIRTEALTEVFHA